MDISNSLGNKKDVSNMSAFTRHDRERLAARGHAEEVLPLGPDERTWGTKNYITVWMGPIHNILSYFTVVGFFALGLNAMQVVAAILVAACIVSAGYVYNGRAAAKYGIPFAMQIRDTFGMKGAVFPAMIRGLVAGFVFFGLTTIASAQALDIVLLRLFPGFAEIGGGATIAGLAIPTAISYAVMTALTVILYIAGQSLIDKFSAWASPVVWILMVIGLFIAVGNAGGIGAVMRYHPAPGTEVTVVGFITCVSMLVSNWAGPIVNTGDFTRNAKTISAPAKGFPIGMLISYVLFAAVTISFMASLSAVTDGAVDVTKPTIFVDAINAIDNPFIVILLILAMNVGATAFVVFGNMLPSGLQLTAQFPQLFNVKTGGLVAAVVGTLILPWKFVENTTMLFLFYSFIGSMFGPIAGIMLASYYFERRQKLDLDTIYPEPGADGGHPGGVNRRAVGVLVGSFIITMVGKVFPNVPVLATINSWAFFSGLTIGFIGYLLVGARKKA
ncbi:cytosine permease [Photobacterium sp. MCCC 1A19761]|uniref:cytosine permease n=1 Tax=Photobacterium sp. MCCC 1A19761 TaxID=3115000 RepID=UPI00307FC006